MDQLENVKKGIWKATKQIYTFYRKYEAAREFIGSDPNKLVEALKKDGITVVNPETMRLNTWETRYLDSEGGKMSYRDVMNRLKESYQEWHFGYFQPACRIA